MANSKKHSLPKGVNTTWPGNPAGSLSGKAPSSVKKPKAQGITPGKTAYGIANTSRKNSSAVTGAKRNTPSAQGLLSSKAKRQVG